MAGTSNNSDANQFNSSSIATSPLYTKKYNHPHGEGWGETWGKFTREVPHPWDKVHSDLVKSPPMPHPAPGVGGGGLVGRIIDRAHASDVTITKKMGVAD